MRHKKFLGTRKCSQAFSKTSSFFGLDDDEIETHLRIRDYGEFVLTKAVSPSYDLQIIPTSGYLLTSYNENRMIIPALVISASANVLVDLFLDLSSLLGPVVDIYLESSFEQRETIPHTKRGIEANCQKFVSEDIDNSVARSTFIEYEDLLLNDGCTGIALVDGDLGIEIYFDEHKLLVIYGWPNMGEEILAILKEYGIQEDCELKTICDGEHMHSTNVGFYEQFKKLIEQIGALEND